LVLIGIVAVSTVLLSMKSQFASLIEQRHDIGILKSIGWSDEIIAIQLLAESILQAVAGSILGLAAAAVIIIILPSFQIYPAGLFPDIRLSPLIFVTGFFLGLAGGIAASIFPAYIAAGQRPSQLLRSL
jgi:ABC-type lipoprotein release transport system permease subunit